MKAPFTQLLAMIFAAATILQDLVFIVGRSNVAGSVSRVSIIPGAAFTGANTNTRSFELINKGQSGSGTTVVASVSLTSGKNLVAFDEYELTLSPTLANRVVVKGDVLVLASTHVGTGIADTGGGVCQVEISRTVGS